ncbi:MAG: ferritin-like protein [Acidimicrobiia bacterium]|nr:ferritin-like protein [Acidimicrobiia bacterium]NNL71382.1 hypothetical protein [Acidimicrobiia bacterium]
MPIETVEDLRSHVRLAIQVELSTIPPYLVAMYSIEDQQSEAALLIRSIVAEEMLHAALCANLLVAIGGRPSFAPTELIPSYPMWLPHHRPPLQLRLVACSIDLIRDVLMRVEQPEVSGAPAEADVFETLGQFYHALELAIAELDDDFDLFSDPQRDHQMGDAAFYRPVAFDAEDSGGLLFIDDVASAVEALEIIVHQGEGLSTDRWADPAHQELTHYHKLAQIADGTSPLGDVFPLRPDAVTAGYSPDVAAVSDLFNAAYRYLYLVLDELFGPAADKSRPVGRLYRLMSDVMSELAHYLVRQQLEDGSHAAPTFEIYEFGADPSTELTGLAGRVDEVINPGSSTFVDKLAAIV